MSSTIVCTCQSEELTTLNEFGGSFTKSEIWEDFPALICIKCGKCVAIKGKEVDSPFSRIEEVLQDPLVSNEDGWKRVRNEDDGLRHRLLNFGIYKVNEPPDTDAYECLYSSPIKDIDDVYLLWVSNKASGFVTVRPFHEDNIDVIDTVFLRQSARSKGYMTKFVKTVLLKDKRDLGFSQPVSNKMLKSLLRLLMKCPEFRERIWIVDQDSDEKQILWWSAAKIARQRNLVLKDLLGSN